jgi:hypothetical protein
MNIGRSLTAIVLSLTAWAGTLGAQASNDVRQIHLTALRFVKPQIHVEGFRLLFDPGERRQEVARAEEMARVLGATVVGADDRLVCDGTGRCNPLRDSAKVVVLAEPVIDGDTASIVVQVRQNALLPGNRRFVGGSIHTLRLARVNGSWKVVAARTSVS